MKEQYNILIAGVGGQGNLVCGRVLATAALRQGLTPTIGETFGASRRGGTVLTHLRLGSEDLGPLIPQGQLDLLLGLEPLESLRAAVDLATPRTTAIASTAKVETPESIAGRAVYPEVTTIGRSLRAICGTAYLLDPSEAFLKAGTKRSLNVYMIGALVASALTPLSENSIIEALKTTLREWDINQVSFEGGKNDFARIANA
ncbi:MAG: indolepyruvate oxidoreductase subunit beta [Candidatus Thorarchaeota archaeon]|nr:indolepyruvate oxidoreductase subunit beta [Candidatus Thorarchaeota archaeon]